MRTGGAGGQAVSLSDEICAYLLALIVRDLGLSAEFPDIPADVPDFYGHLPPDQLVLSLKNVLEVFEKLVGLERDAVTYFACLARLMKSRLKYARILSTQPFPTLEQVGPRGLLQFGSISPHVLAAFMFWRKWFFDIDNRAGQETGYLFEPVIAATVGGVPYSARKSPVRSHRDGKGRQVDCLLDTDAYEFKIRVTIAASGQGRWSEELDYPTDCKHSGYRPVLVILDGTENPKMRELVAAFEKQGGAAHVGDLAWAHLEGLAGDVMSRFLERYVRGPINELIAEAPGSPLPEMTAKDHGNSITIRIGGEELSISRAVAPTDEAGDAIPDELPDDDPGIAL